MRAKQFCALTTKTIYEEDWATVKCTHTHYPNYQTPNPVAAVHSKVVFFLVFVSLLNIPPIEL